MLPKSMVIAFVGIVAGTCLGSLAKSGWEEHHTTEATVIPKRSEDTKGPEPAKLDVSPRPSLEEVLGASSDAELIGLLGKYLPEATLEDLKAIADDWGNAFHFFNYLEEGKWKLLLHRWVAVDPGGALVCVDELQGNKYYTKRLRHFCYSAWAELDIKAALASAEASPYECLPGLIGVLVEQDLDLALSLLTRYPKVPDIAKKVLGKLAETDPTKALAMAKDLPSIGREDALRAVLAIQAKSDPEVALTEALELNSFKTRFESAVDIINEIANTNPDKAKALVEQLPLGEVRENAFEALTRSLVRQDPEAALAWAKGLPVGNERQTAIAISLYNLVERDPKFDVLATLDELGWETVLSNSPSYGVRTPNGRASGSRGGSTDKNLGGIASDAIKNLAKTDPQRALSYLVKLPYDAESSHNLRTEAAGSVINTWFKEEPSEALSALTALPAVGVREQVARHLVGPNAAEETIRQMADHISEIDDEATLKIIATLLARRLGTVDPNEAVAWVSELPENVRDQAMNSALWGFMADHPKLAQEQILQMEPGDIRKRSVTRMVETLAGQDVDSAITWFNSLGIEDQHPEAVGALAGGWFSKNPTEAAEWAADLPPDLRDEASWNFVRQSYRNQNYTQASQWAESIQDEAKREEALSRTFQDWLQRDPAAAKQALQDSVLAEEVKRRLLGQ